MKLKRKQESERYFYRTSNKSNKINYKLETKVRAKTRHGTYHQYACFFLRLLVIRFRLNLFNNTSERAHWEGKRISETTISPRFKWRGKTF